MKIPNISPFLKRNRETVLVKRSAIGLLNKEIHFQKYLQPDYNKSSFRNQNSPKFIELTIMPNISPLLKRNREAVVARRPEIVLFKKRMRMCINISTV